MNLIKSDVASIKHNEQEGVRVQLSSARGDDGLYFVVTDSGEDTGHRFDTEPEVIDGIKDIWGQSPAWDLQFAGESVGKL